MVDPGLITSALPALPFWGPVGQLRWRSAICPAEPQILSTLRNFSFFFFNDTATTEIYTLSLHDALPISSRATHTSPVGLVTRARHCSNVRPKKTHGSLDDIISAQARASASPASGVISISSRSEEHTSELQSLTNLVCRLLLAKKKTVMTC